VGLQEHREAKGRTGETWRLAGSVSVWPSHPRKCENKHFGGCACRRKRTTSETNLYPMPRLMRVSLLTLRSVPARWFARSGQALDFTTAPTCASAERALFFDDLHPECGRAPESHPGQVVQRTARHRNEAPVWQDLAFFVLRCDRMIA
jgi:hypothetical protein